MGLTLVCLFFVTQILHSGVSAQQDAVLSTGCQIDKGNSTCTKGVLSSSGKNKWSGGFTFVDDSGCEMNAVLCYFYFSKWSAGNCKKNTAYLKIVIRLKQTSSGGWLFPATPARAWVQERFDLSMCYQTKYDEFFQVITHSWTGGGSTSAAYSYIETVGTGVQATFMLKAKTSATFDIEAVHYKMPDNSRTDCHCPGGFVKHRCLCYAARNATTWNEAENKCTSMHPNAHLTSMMNQEEMNDLTQFVRSVWWDTFWNSSYESLAWIFIGLKDQNKTGDIRWTDSNPLTFTSWYHPGYSSRLPTATRQSLFRTIPTLRFQPGNVDTDKCSVMFISLPYFHSDQMWFMAPCNMKIPAGGFICKVRATRNDSVTTNETRGPVNTTRTPENTTRTPVNTRNSSALGTFMKTCKSGWTFAAGKCYKLFRVPTQGVKHYPPGSYLPIDDYFSTCTNQSATLVDTSKAMSFIRNLLRIWRYYDFYGRVTVAKLGTNGTTREVDSLMEIEPRADVRAKDQFYFVNRLHESFKGYPFDLKNKLVSEEQDRFLADPKLTRMHPAYHKVICERLSIERFVSCGKNQFSCVDGTCISRSYVCDGKLDCLDGEDETGHVCRSGIYPMFVCGDGTKLAFTFYCDFHPDCTDGSDEMGCIHPDCELGQFRCKNGQCLNKSERCDLRPQCRDGSDEVGCTSSDCSQFDCMDEKCIPTALRKDLYPDCPGMTQEDEDATIEEIYRGQLSLADVGKEHLPYYLHTFRAPYCSVQGETRCWMSHSKCYPRDHACIYDVDVYGKMTSCRDGSHLNYCKDFECPDLFKCRDSYCIPTKMICDGAWDCPYGEDETDCEERSCPGYFGCHGRQNCLDQREVCDGRLHCPETDDERFCNIRQCHNSCTCHGFVIGCSFSGINDTSWVPQGTRALNLTGSNVILNNETFSGLFWLGWLDLSSSHIYVIGSGTFFDLRNLLYLDLRHNHIASLLPFAFDGLVRVDVLLLQGNGLVSISPDAFVGLTLNNLDLSGQRISNLVSYSFREMNYLENLTLRGNDIKDIEIQTFSGLGNLSYLDLSANEIGAIEHSVFEPLSLSQLITDEFRFCCAANVTGVHAQTCQPAPDEFSSCSDLLADQSLQSAVWVLGCLSLVGNLFVFIWRTCRQTGNKVDNILIRNLSIADFLMGIYLIIIASADVYFRGTYAFVEHEWRQGGLCKLSGILSILSSEMSVFTLVFVTSERAAAVVFPFKTKRPTPRTVLTVLIVAWLSVLTLALIPLVDVGFFANFYGRNGVCLPLTFGRSREGYSVVILIVNLVAMCIISVGYSAIYVTIRRSRRMMKDMGQQTTQEKEVSFLKNMSMVIATDFACWTPIIVIKLMSMNGTRLNPDLAAWVAVVVLPLNSAINPYLYTIAIVNNAGKKPGFDKRNIQNPKKVEPMKKT